MVHLTIGSTLYIHTRNPYLTQLSYLNPDIHFFYLFKVSIHVNVVHMSFLSHIGVISIGSSSILFLFLLRTVRCIVSKFLTIIALQLANVFLPESVLLILTKVISIVSIISIIITSIVVVVILMWFRIFIALFE